MSDEMPKILVPLLIANDVAKQTLAGRTQIIVSNKVRYPHYSYIP